MDLEELSGVLAHELTHVRHFDVLISPVAATVVGALTLAARATGWAVRFGRGATAIRAAEVSAACSSSSSRPSRRS
jgi:Zn-dependent protease with chaperone function